jgi:hypothetical protein
MNMQDTKTLHSTDHYEDIIVFKNADKLTKGDGSWGEEGSFDTDFKEND